MTLQPVTAPWDDDPDGASILLATGRPQLVRQLLAVLGFNHGVAGAVDQQERWFVAIDENRGLARYRCPFVRSEIDVGVFDAGGQVEVGNLLEVRDAIAIEVIEVVSAGP